MGKSSAALGRVIASARDSAARGGLDVPRKIRSRRILAAAVGPLARADGGHVSVAVQDLVTGVRASYGGTRKYVTASIVKADILATLLYQERREHETLSPGDRGLAARMITGSDNNAASALWRRAGGAAGVDAANRAFGLRETAAGPGPYWGLTTTTANDQVRLLGQLLTTRSVLPASARGYVRDLMSSVEPGQRWGVPAAADSPAGSVVKNGWLPHPLLWEINSIGEITRNGQPLLVAVLSSGNQAEGGGIRLVERMAEKAAAAVAGG